MVFESIVSNKRNLFWTIFHVVLGFVCTLTPFALIGWFYFILITNINKGIFLLRQGKAIYFITLFSYLISFEVLDRMAKTSPYIPYELGKYMLVSMGILGIFNFGIRSKKGILMALLVTPALFYDLSKQRVLADIINYYLGPLAVGLGIAFAEKMKLKEDQLNYFLKLVFFGCLSSLVFTFFKTPDFEEIEFTLKAQFETTGGHSSNQVSTLLGLGMFLSFYSFFYKKKFSGSLSLDFFFMVGFTIQGLLSFSRGGMIVGGVGILLILLFLNKKFNLNKIFILIFGIFILACVFIFTDKLTNGNLILRYQGETQGTLIGSKEITVDHFVTGRLSIFENDFELWLRNPIMGVGIGASTYIRDDEKLKKVAAHVELSRLFADHGILGIIFAVLFFGLLRNYNETNSILWILLVIAILSTFHAAMRTFVTPLFIIIGSMNLKTIKS